MEKFRDIMKGEHPIDYGSEKSIWKLKNMPKEFKKVKVPHKQINTNGFRERMEGEGAIDYSQAKRLWKIENDQ